MAILVARKLRFVHYAWVIVIVAFTCLLLASGVRSSFGVFLIPLEDTFNTNRSTIALVASVSILINGLVQPIVGGLLDRFGVRAVAIVSLIVGAVGIMATAVVSEFWQIYITYGVVVSAAVGGPSTVMAAVVAARWFAKHRGLAMGVLSSGAAAGQLVIIPLAMELNVLFGWRLSYAVLGIVLLALAVPVGLLLRSDPAEVGLTVFGGEDALSLEALEHRRGPHPRSHSLALPEGEGIGSPLPEGEAGGAQRSRVRDPEGEGSSVGGTPLLRAARTQEFWMLAFGFFVCGYTSLGMIGTHLVAYTVEHGIDQMAAAAGLGLMGAVNVVGTIWSGAITDRLGCKNPLALIYFTRGLALVYLLFVADAASLDAFAVIFGLSYIATVPPTSALAAQLFGRLSVGVIFGAIFMVHQIGAALGSYLTGLVFDMSGQYYYGLAFGALLCFAAAAASYSIKEERVYPLALPGRGLG